MKKTLRPSIWLRPLILTIGLLGVTLTGAFLLGPKVLELLELAAKVVLLP